MFGGLKNWWTGEGTNTKDINKDASVDAWKTIFPPDIFNYFQLLIVKTALGEGLLYS